MEYRDLSLSEIGILSAHLLKFSVYFAKHKNYISIFERIQGYHPRLSMIGLRGDKLDKPQSILVDYNTIYHRNCDVFVNTGAYSRIYFQQIEHLYVDRAHFRVFLKLSKYTRIFIRTKVKKYSFYVLNTTDKRHEHIKLQLESILQKHQIEKDNPSFNTLVFWDYDNISLSSKTSYGEDETAKQINQALKQFEPIDEMICMSANKMENDEVVKVKKIVSDSQIRREPMGDDSVDKALNREIEERLGTYPNQVVIISGDHYYENAVRRLLKEGVQVYLVSYEISTNRRWLELLDETYRIVLKSSKSSNTTETISCDQCGKLVHKNEEMKHRSTHSHSCNFCETVKQDEKALYQHTRAKHPEMVCDDCKKIFTKEQSVEQHRKMKHQDRYCVPCKRLFSSENGLQSHTENSNKHKGLWDR